MSMLLVGFSDMQHHVWQTDSEGNQNEKPSSRLPRTPLSETSFITGDAQTTRQTRTEDYYPHISNKGGLGWAFAAAARDCRSLTRRTAFLENCIK